MGNMDFQRNFITLRVTKKYKQRLVTYDEKLADIICRYCAAMGILTESRAYLFPTIDKDIPLTLNTVRNNFKGILKSVGIQFIGIYVILTVGFFMIHMDSHM